MDPPPKNGGAPCPGPSHEKVPCGLQLCPGDTGKGKLGLPWQTFVSRASGAHLLVLFSAQTVSQAVCM